ncbi:hypothetical protein KIW84_064227 [Lathyrus oleraceus]|uniref:Retrotransposon gag domain-containing protein n=1 Tax=Pisum sativum TaxID=3888 RepID=A0A9D5AAS3_PEA|nr:hypothetical protein KIW84_064227 [Pisum sativum]
MIADPLYVPWIRCNTMVLAWLHRSILKSIAMFVLYIDSANDVWHNLQLQFSHIDIFRISDLQEDLYKLRQGTFYVSKYFTQLKKYREQDCVIRFLKELNENFTHSKSQIMMMNPLPDIDKALSVVIQQEREMNKSISIISKITSNSEEAVACQFHTNSGNYNVKPSYFKGKTHGNNGARGHNHVCTHYGRTNHTA